MLRNPSVAWRRHFSCRRWPGGELESDIVVQPANVKNRQHGDAAAMRRTGGGHGRTVPGTRPAGPGEARGGASMNLFTKGLMSAAAAAALLFAGAHDNA